MPDDLRPTDLLLRKLLWLRHGCPISSLYGDDGEMQCGRCIIDFKRAPVADIENRFQRLAYQAMADEQARAKAAPQPATSATPDLDAAQHRVDEILLGGGSHGVPMGQKLAHLALEERAEEADRAASMYPTCKCHAGFTNRGLIDPDCRHCDDSKEFTGRAKFLRSQVRP